MDIPFKHGSLFSGIGGFDLAAQWMGWDNIFHCEWNPFGQKILKHYWPEAISYEDITKTDFTIHRGQIDILTGGFPCQPYSSAGKRKGKDDERHLWPHMLRAIEEIKPRWVVGENVLGLVNWSGGLVFEEVQTQLEDQGYEVQAFVLPACGVGAPHRRERVWFVARSKGVDFDRFAIHPLSQSDGRHNTRASSGAGLDMVANIMDQAGRNEGADESDPSGEHGINTHPTDTRPESIRREGQDEVYGSESATNSPLKQGEWLRSEQCETSKSEQEQSGGDGSSVGDQRHATNTNTNTSDTRLQGSEIIRGAGGIREKRNKFFAGSFPSDWQEFPTQSPVCSRNDGLSLGLDAITFSKWREESIKGYGNAIVPNVVFEIFKAIEQYESMESSNSPS